MTDNVKHIFNVFVSHVCIFFKEVSILILCHLFNWVFVFSSLSCEFFIYSGRYTLIWYMISSCFLPFCELQLYFLDTVFWNKLIYILKVSWFKVGGNRTAVFRCGKKICELRFGKVSSVKPQWGEKSANLKWEVSEWGALSLHSDVSGLTARCTGIIC